MTFDAQQNIHTFLWFKGGGGGGGGICNFIVLYNKLI